MNAHDLLQENLDRILSLWSQRIAEEVGSAFELARPTLENEIPLFLDQMVLALAKNKKVDRESVRLFDIESVRLGKLHGGERSRTADYLLTEVITEYHILRQVVMTVLEGEGPIGRIERDIIWDMIDQATNDAAVQFTDAHMEIREQFANALTHDLRTPITSALGYAESITQRTDDPEISHPASRIMVLMKRLDDMIHDLLDASLIRSGEVIRLEVVTCDLEEILQNVVEDLTLGRQRHRLSVKAHSSVRGKFGADGIRRAIENLIGNAFKYSSENTPITISLEKTDRGGKITVHNLGKMIPKEDQKLLFQQYRRLKNVEYQSGWGIGLTLVRGVVDFHHGSVEIVSTEKEGTSFIMDIPAISQEERPDLLPLPAL